jgi:D-glycero-D-manno-heptose 1,7-bisphosphate phosphatase
MNLRSNKVVLLDRDGVLNIDLPNSVRSISQLQIEPSALTGVADLTKSGYIVLVITNQGAIGRGEMSREEVDRINEMISKYIADAGGYITRYYICPHSSEDNCDCRKPKTGLLRQAFSEWNFDLSTTWFLGDSGRDAESAMSFGVRPAMVLTGKGSHESLLYPHVPSFSDISTFAKFLINQDIS